MTLDEYRLAQGWNYAKLAEFLGHDQKKVRRWCLPFVDAEFRRPQDDVRLTIRDKTGGKVDLGDWFPKPALPAAAAAVAAAPKRRRAP